MEDFPNRHSPEVSGDDQNSKKKKANKSASVEKDVPQKETKPELSALDKALANLVVKKQEQAKADDKTAEKPDSDKEDAKAESTAEATESAEDGAKAEETAEVTPEPASESASEPAVKHEAKAESDPESEDKAEYQPLPELSLESSEFIGGEVVIHLQGDKPVAERVVSVSTEQTSEASASEPAETGPSVQPTEATVFRTQPEQQHQAQAEQEPPSPELIEAARQAAVKMPKPEQVDPEFAMLSDLEPARSYPEYTQREGEPQVIATPPERGATKQEIEDAIYYATKAGQNRGVVTGLLVGGAYEHFKHKRREKRAEKRYKAQGKKLEAVEQSNYFNQQEQEKRQAEQAARLNAAERRYESAEQRFQSSEKRSRNTEERLRNAERRSPGHEGDKTSERQSAPNPEQVAAAAEAERLSVPPEHRLQTSAWHTIEVDSKTGRPVETPAFQYGHEYYRERAQEATPAQHRNAATGGIALVGAAGGAQQAGDSGAGSDSGQVLPPNIPSATRRGVPTGRSQQTQTTDTTQQTVDDTGPRLWPWLVALLAVIIGLVVILT